MSSAAPYHHDTETCEKCAQVAEANARNLVDHEKADVARGRLISDSLIEKIAARTVDLLLEKLHPSILNPPAEGPSPVGADPGKPGRPVSTDDVRATYPVSKGQIAAFNAKLGDLARMLHVDKARLKTAALEWAGQRSFPSPHEVTSTKDLTFDEMSDVLDWLEARVERERG